MLNANVKELVQFEKEPQIYPKQITKLSMNRECILLHSPPKNELGCILSHPNLSHPEKDSWMSGKLEQMSSLFWSKCTNKLQNVCVPRSTKLTYIILSCHMHNSHTGWVKINSGDAAGICRKVFGQNKIYQQ